MESEYDRSFWLKQIKGQAQNIIGDIDHWLDPQIKEKDFFERCALLDSLHLGEMVDSLWKEEDIKRLTPSPTEEDKELADQIIDTMVELTHKENK